MYNAGDLVQDDVVGTGEHGLMLVTFQFSYIPDGPNGPFLMARTPVTQTQWRTVMERRNGMFDGWDLPVDSVTADKAKLFCETISGFAGLTKKQIYRIPTEKEWLHALKAGSEFPIYGNLREIAWLNINSGNTTHPVGQLLPNAWNLYDMIGNISEMVWPFAEINQKYMGGSYRSDPTDVVDVRSSTRDPWQPTPDCGFRICRSL